MNILNSEKEQISSLNKFHFAMKGKWDEDMTHTTSIESSEQVSNWFAGLLKSIKTELEYIDKNRNPIPKQMNSQINASSIVDTFDPLNM